MIQVESTKDHIGSDRYLLQIFILTRKRNDLKTFTFKLCQKTEHLEGC